MLRIDSVEEARNDRFHRLKLISWWDQRRLNAAKVLLVGAGALGNEIAKNLALLGVGNLYVIDLDTVEHSNLSRSVLFREGDDGAPKAEVVARAVREIYPQMRVQWQQGNVIYDLGLGVFRWADVVLGALDNREARLAINRAALKVGRSWIDGAIEQLNGVARVFTPGGACYECTMSKDDWRILESRRSCALLTREQMLAGHTPTTPTSASIIGAVQVQEAVKLLHGLETLAGKGFQYSGLNHESYVVEYPRKEECYSHDAFGDIAPIDEGVADIRLGELLEFARSRLGQDAVIELNNDIVTRFTCRQCERSEDVFRSLGALSERHGRCPRCERPRELETTATLYGDESFLDRTFAEIGVPPYDIVTGRAGDTRLHVEFSGDRETVLGPLRGER